MSRYPLDTNHIGEAVGRVSVVRDRVQQMHRQGHIFASCVPVLGELLVGIVQRKDAAKTRRRRDGLLQVVRIWPLEPATADHYARVYHELKTAGRPMSQVDMFLAAMVRHTQAILLTTDGDFQAFSDIRTENWLVP